MAFVRLNKRHVMLCYVMYEKWVQPMSQPKFWVYGPVTHVETPLASHNAI